MIYHWSTVFEEDREGRLPNIISWRPLCGGVLTEVGREAFFLQTVEGTVGHSVSRKEIAPDVRSRPEPRRNCENGVGIDEKYIPLGQNLNRTKK